jgi:PilZ domain
MDSHISEIFGSNRRRVIRRQVRLSASVSSLLREAPDGRASSPPLSVLGYTRDISADGLALIVPSLQMGDVDLSSGEHTLRIILALPAGDVEMHAALVRHERLEERGPEIGFLIGVRISQMGEDERDLYDEYLRTLGGE